MTKRYHKDPAAIATLDAEQYHVTQQNGTERPFTNAFHDSKRQFMWILSPVSALFFAR